MDTLSRIGHRDGYVLSGPLEIPHVPVLVSPGGRFNASRDRLPARATSIAVEMQED
jgi:hypothetical protein